MTRLFVVVLDEEGKRKVVFPLQEVTPAFIDQFRKDTLGVPVYFCREPMKVWPNPCKGVMVVQEVLFDDGAK